jgi:cytochrome b6-f complex iron-sulfur subunit
MTTINEESFKGKFWLARSDIDQVVALYKVCTHPGCLYSWVETEDKFICPCHGSQFELDGNYK